MSPYRLLVGVENAVDVLGLLVSDLYPGVPECIQARNASLNSSAVVPGCSHLLVNNRLHGSVSEIIVSDAIRGGHGSKIWLHVSRGSHQHSCKRAIERSR